MTNDKPKIANEKCSSIQHPASSIQHLTSSSSSLFQGFFNCPDQLLTIDNSITGQNFIALFVVNEGCRQDALPVLIDDIDHLLGIISFLYENIEPGILFFDEWDHFGFDIGYFIRADRDDLYAFITIFLIDHDEFGEFDHTRPAIGCPEVDYQDIAFYRVFIFIVVNRYTPSDLRLEFLRLSFRGSHSFFILHAFDQAAECFAFAQDGRFAGAQFIQRFTQVLALHTPEIT